MRQITRLDYDKEVTDILCNKELSVDDMLGQILFLNASVEFIQENKDKEDADVNKSLL